MNEISIHYPCTIAPKPVKDFVSVLSKTTDCPETFLTTVGLAVLSVIAGPNVSVMAGTNLNNFYCLLGDTGLTRKTTAIKWGQKLLRDIVVLKKPSVIGSIKTSDNTFEHCAIELITSFSVEGLESAFEGRGKSVIACPPEYRQIFDVGKRQAQANTITVLTSMFDGLDVNVRLRQSKLKIEQSSLTILSGSTQSWFKEALSTQNVDGGFLNRHVLAIGQPSATPLIEPIEPDANDWNQVVELFANLVPDISFDQDQSKSVPIFNCKKIMLFLNEEARLMWRQYATENHQVKIQLEEYERNAVAREEAHAIKLAGLRAFGEQRNEINTQDVLFGTEYAKASANSSLVLVRQSRQSLSPDSNRLYNLILRIFVTEHRTTKKRDIAKYFGGRQDKWAYCLLELLAGKKIVGGEDKGFLPSDIPTSICENNGSDISNLIASEVVGLSDSKLAVGVEYEA